MGVTGNDSGNFNESADFEELVVAEALAAGKSDVSKERAEHAAAESRYARMPKQVHGRSIDSECQLTITVRGSCAGDTTAATGSCNIATIPIV